LTARSRIFGGALRATALSQENMAHPRAGAPQINELYLLRLATPA
jgi:hypothetical protein